MQRHVDSPISLASHVYRDLPLVACQPSPFSRLPPEVISTIFMSIPRTRRGGIPLRFAVSEVSRRWRTIALETPHLWTYIHITPNMPTELIVNYLRRSGSLGLDIRINFWCIPENLIDLSRVLSPVIPQAWRWNHLAVIASSRKAIQLALSEFGPIAAPRLQSIHIAQPTFSQPVFDFEKETIFRSGAPALTALRVQGMIMNHDIYPLATITSLCLQDSCDNGPSMGLWDLLTILTNMPKLRHLSLFGSTFAGQIPIFPPVVLASLLSLDIGQPPSWVVLRAISAPLLQSLVVRKVNRRGFNSFVPPNRDEYSNVRSLTFVSCSSSYVQICHYFRNITHLAVLYTDPKPILNHFSPAFLPLFFDLRSLTLLSVNIDLLCSVMNDPILKRRRPPLDLRLGSAIIFELHAAGRLQGLRKRVKVERVQKHSVLGLRWPPDLEGD